MIILLLFLSTFSYISCWPPVLKIYGDVYKDKRFFEDVFPWIVGNLGGFVKVEYNLLGSGVYSVPQMCALSLLSNVFLQATYLKCEASGMNPPEICLCLINVDPQGYRKCVYSKGYLFRDAYNRYTDKFSNVETPIVETSKWTLSGTQNLAEDYLDDICPLLGSKPPITCSQPLSDLGHRGAANYNCSLLDSLDAVLNQFATAKQKYSTKGKLNNKNKKTHNINKQFHNTQEKEIITEEENLLDDYLVSD